MWAEILLGLDESFARIHRVFVLIPRNSNREWKRIQFQLKHIKIIKRRRFKWGKHSYKTESLYLSLLAFCLRPTLWHTSFFVGFPRWGNFQRISWLYDMIPEKLKIATAYETTMKFKTLNTANTILSISHYSQLDLEEIWPQFKQKSQVVHICTAKMTLAESSASYFIHLGMRKGYKNFLPAAIEILQDSRFSSYSIYVVGGDNEWSQEEEKAFRELRVKERVRLFGTLDLEKIQALIASSSAILFPSLYEGFGLPVLEAFLAGIPVLACRTSSIPEITGEDYPLAQPNICGSYANTLSRLLTEKEKWVEYGKKRGELFGREQLIRSLEKIYAF